MAPANPLRWVFDPKSVRYRDLATGRYVSSKQVVEWARIAADRSGDIVRGYADMLVSDRLTVTDWERLMRSEIKKEYIRQYMAGRGGLHQMQHRDWSSIGGMLKEQYSWLSNFARQIAAGNLTAGQIAMRSAMYIRSAQEAFWRALERAQKMPPLPAYPGDGSSECLTNCRCNWDITRHTIGTVATWDCYWRLGRAEHCGTCVDRASSWNPLVLRA